MSKTLFPAIKAATVVKASIEGRRTLFSTLLKTLPEGQWPEQWDAAVAPEPAPTQWSTIGLVKEYGASFPLLQPDAITFAVQTNDRVLPSKVRDEVLTQRVADIQEREGRRPSKKEYRELRDEVEASLLPRAFVKRSVTLVSFLRNGKLIIWASSARRFDVVFAVVLTALQVLGIDRVAAVPIIGGENVSISNAVLLPIAKNESDEFAPGMSALLAGDDDEGDQRLVRLKNVEHSEMHRLLKHGYSLRALEIAMGDDDAFSFTLNNQFVFTKMGLGDIRTEDGDKDDKVGAFTSTLFLVMKSLDSASTAMCSMVDEDDDAL
jgi:DNA recombination-dependent growth factor C